MSKSLLLLGIAYRSVKMRPLKCKKKEMENYKCCVTVQAPGQSTAFGKKCGEYRKPNHFKMAHRPV